MDKEYSHEISTETKCVEGCGSFHLLKVRS